MIELLDTMRIDHMIFQFNSKHSLINKLKSIRPTFDHYRGEVYNQW